MKICFGIVLSFLLFASCDSKSETRKEIQVDYIELVKTLGNNDAKIGYLQGIESLDESTRKAERDALVQKGYNSKEHLAAKAELLRAEKVNIEKVEAFLNIWGYPDKRSLKINAADMPIKVIHASDDLTVKKRNFKFLFKAFNNQQIPGSSFTSYLNKYYELSTGERMTIPNPYSEVFELDTLLRSLKLQ